MRGGEYVALLGRDRVPFTGRSAPSRLAEPLHGAREPADSDAGLPPRVPLPRHARLVLVGDFLSPLEDIDRLVRSYGGSAVAGHLLQVLDPAEERFPFAGRTEFRGLENEPRVLLDRVQNVRADYLERLGAHRSGLAGDIARAGGWTFASHCTDRRPEVPLMSLYEALANDMRRRRAPGVLSLGPLAFVDPWLLAGLAALPAIWWLLKATPPAPRRVDFAAVRLLLGLATPERTPAHMPWWLLLLRLTTAALVILALAHPLLNPGAGLRGDGPLLLVVDDDWAAAPRWERRSRALLDLIAEAEHAGKPVAIVTTAPTASGAAAPVSLLTAGDAREAAQAIVPKPWPSDRAAAAAALGAVAWEQAAEVVWLSNGLRGAEDALLAALSRLGPVRVLADPDHELAMTLAAPRSDGRELRIEAGRVAGPARGVWVRASGERGQLLARRQLDFAAGAARAAGAFAIPVEAAQPDRADRHRGSTVGRRHRAARRTLAAPPGRAGLGRRAPRTRSPCCPACTTCRARSSPSRRSARAASTSCSSRSWPCSSSPMSASWSAPTAPGWNVGSKRGGVLVRFSGPRLARNVDDLVPVRLRAGGRNIGGALSWAASRRASRRSPRRRRSRASPFPTTFSSTARSWPSRRSTSSTRPGSG